MNDPMVDEVRRIRDAHAARFNYDLDAVFQDIREREKKSGLKFVRVVRQGIEIFTPQDRRARVGIRFRRNLIRDGHVNVFFNARNRPQNRQLVFLPCRNDDLGILV